MCNQPAFTLFVHTRCIMGNTSSSTPAASTPAAVSPTEGGTADDASAYIPEVGGVTGTISLATLFPSYAQGALNVAANTSFYSDAPLGYTLTQIVAQLQDAFSGVPTATILSDLGADAATEDPATFSNALTAIINGYGADATDGGIVTLPVASFYKTREAMCRPGFAWTFTPVPNATRYDATGRIVSAPWDSHAGEINPQAGYMSHELGCRPTCPPGYTWTWLPASYHENRFGMPTVFPYVGPPPATDPLPPYLSSRTAPDGSTFFYVELQWPFGLQMRGPVKVRGGLFDVPVGVNTAARGTVVDPTDLRLLLFNHPAPSSLVAPSANLPFHYESYSYAPLPWWYPVDFNQAPVNMAAWSPVADKLYGYDSNWFSTLNFVTLNGDGTYTPQWQHMYVSPLQNDPWAVAAMEAPLNKGYAAGGPYTLAARVNQYTLYATVAKNYDFSDGYYGPSGNNDGTDISWGLPVDWFRNYRKDLLALGPAWIALMMTAQNSPSSPEAAIVSQYDTLRQRGACLMECPPAASGVAGATPYNADTSNPNDGLYYVHFPTDPSGLQDNPDFIHDNFPSAAGVATAAEGVASNAGFFEAWQETQSVPFGFPVNTELQTQADQTLYPWLFSSLAATAFPDARNGTGAILTDARGRPYYWWAGAHDKHVCRGEARHTCPAPFVGAGGADACLKPAYCPPHTSYVPEAAACMVDCDQGVYGGEHGSTLAGTVLAPYPSTQHNFVAQANTPALANRTYLGPLFFDMGSARPFCAPARVTIAATTDGTRTRYVATAVCPLGWTPSTGDITDQSQVVSGSGAAGTHPVTVPVCLKPTHAALTSSTRALGSRTRAGILGAALATRDGVSLPANDPKILKKTQATVTLSTLQSLVIYFGVACIGITLVAIIIAIYSQVRFAAPVRLALEE